MSFKNISLVLSLFILMGEVMSRLVNNFTVIVLVMVRLEKYKQTIVKTSHFLLFYKNWAVSFTMLTEFRKLSQQYSNIII